jgi:hypothetical protein
MKFGEIKSIAHNIADSLASGVGLLIGVYEMDIFGEAAQTPEGFVVVDFLTGTTASGVVSAAHGRAIELYRHALGSLCEKHGTSPSAFHKLSVQYFADRRFLVTVEDHQGRRSTDEYVGSPGRRVRVLDPLGRVHPSRRLAEHNQNDLAD